MFLNNSLGPSSEYSYIVLWSLESDISSPSSPSSMIIAGQFFEVPQSWNFPPSGLDGYASVARAHLVWI